MKSIDFNELVDKYHLEIGNRFRYTKRFIGNSAKWMNLTEKRRKYSVRFVSRAVLNETEFSITF